MRENEENFIEHLANCNQFLEGKISKMRCRIILNLKKKKKAYCIIEKLQNIRRHGGNNPNK